MTSLFPHFLSDPVVSQIWLHRNCTDLTYFLLIIWTYKSTCKNGNLSSLLLATGAHWTSSFYERTAMNSLILLWKAPLNLTYTVMYCGFVVPLIRSKRPFWIKLPKILPSWLTQTRIISPSESCLFLEWLEFNAVSWNCGIFSPAY